MELERITRALIRPCGGYVYLSWIVRSPQGATHFHFDALAQPSEYRIAYGEDCWGYAGVETHWASPPDYMKDDKPSHEHCDILGAPCWHDGTSLWASEHWMPGVRQFGSDWIWTELERAHRRTFGE